MVEKRKSVSKHPYQHRRRRIPTPDLLFPYLPGPELFVSPPMSTVQTRPVHLMARSSSSLNNVSSPIPGHHLFANPTASFALNLVPSTSSPLYTEPDAAEDLSIRSTSQSIFPPCMDWCGPFGPSTSYMAPIQSNSMISIGSNHHSDIERFFQDFKLLDYTLDSFSGRLLDVVSNTTFSSGDVQSELHHAIARFTISACILKL